MESTLVRSCTDINQRMCSILFYTYLVEKTGELCINPGSLGNALAPKSEKPNVPKLCSALKFICTVKCFCKSASFVLYVQTFFSVCPTNCKLRTHRLKIETKAVQFVF